MTAKDIGPGKVYKGKDWEVTAAVAEHVQPWLDSLAYRVDSLDGSIVFTGDTRACDSVTELSRGSDVMLCMCWDLQQRMDEANLTQAMCGTLDAAHMAQEAGVGRLVLVAYSRVPGSGVRGRGSGEGETTASSLAGKEESSRKEDNSGQGKDGPAGAIAQGGNGQ